MKLFPKAYNVLKTHFSLAEPKKRKGLCHSLSLYIHTHTHRIHTPRITKPCCYATICCTSIWYKQGKASTALRGVPPAHEATTKSTHKKGTSNSCLLLR